MRAADLTDLICLSVDVEWAHDEVLADLVGLLDARGLKATFFCTHAGVSVAGHERALHPNFLRDGDVLRRVGPVGAEITDGEVYRQGPRARPGVFPGEGRG